MPHDNPQLERSLSLSLSLSLSELSGGLCHKGNYSNRFQLLLNWGVVCRIYRIDFIDQIRASLGMTCNIQVYSKANETYWYTCMTQWSYLISDTTMADNDLFDTIIHEIQKSYIKTSYYVHWSTKASKRRCYRMYCFLLNKQINTAWDTKLTYSLKV